uniref:Uncharacterized protein n=1 Tax=Romanomermis culicivorax TaxID=13658 RepID=A0A915HJF3_ROMCU
MAWLGNWEVERRAIPARGMAQSMGVVVMTKADCEAAVVVVMGVVADINVGVVEGGRAKTIVGNNAVMVVALPDLVAVGCSTSIGGQRQWKTGRVNLVPLFTLRLMMRGNATVIMMVAITRITISVMGLVSFAAMLIIMLVEIASRSGGQQFLSQLIEQGGAGGILDNSEGIQMSGFDHEVFIFLLSVGVELGSEKSQYSSAVISSIKRNYDGVFTMDKGEEGGPIFGHCSEGFKDKHCSIGKRELDVPGIARGGGMVRHGDREFEIFQIGSKDGFSIKADQCIAPKIWHGLGRECGPQTSGGQENGWTSAGPIKGLDCDHVVIKAGRVGDDKRANEVGLDFVGFSHAKSSFCLSVLKGFLGGPVAVPPLANVGNGMDIGVGQEIGTDNTLVIVVIIKDDTLNHMFPESRFHGNNDGTGEEGSVGNFDLSTNGE